MNVNHQAFIEQALTTFLGHKKQNIVTIQGNDNIVIQDVVTDQIVITQNINGIDEATFMKEVVAKIVSRFPLAPTSIPKELNTIRMATPRKIIGRTYEVHHIMDRLNKDNSLLLVSGIGGIGKTVTANYYYTLFHELYQHILWLQAGQDLETTLLFDASLHESLGLSEKLRPLMPYDKEENRNYALALLEKSLKNLPPRTLFLIDNATEKDFRTIQKWQSTFKQFHFLITSRSQNTNLNTYELGVLPKEDALALFYTHYRFEQEDTLAFQILEQLHYHTLLIELIAKAGQEGAIPLQDLLVFLQTGYIQHEGLQYKIDINEILTDRIPEEERIINYIRLLFNTILKLDEDEQQILLSLSVLPNTPHDKDLLLKIVEGTDKKKAQTPLSPNETIDILNALYRKGYLQRDDQNKHRLYALHALIGTATKEHIPPTVEKLEKVIVNVGDLLYLDEDKDNPIDKFPLIPYGEIILSHFLNSNNSMVIYLQNELGRCMIEAGDYEKAQNIFDKALQTSVQSTDIDSANTSVICANLAMVLRRMGDYLGAKDLMEKVIKADEINFGASHPTTNRHLNNLALILQDLGDYSGAKYLMEKVVKTNEINFGINHPTTAKGYSNLALILKDLGDYLEAKKLLEKTKSFMELNLGENHPNTAQSYSNLAAVLQDLGDYEEAKILLGKAVKSDELNFGEYHTTTAVSYTNLSLVLQILGDYIQAKLLSSKVVYIYEKNPAFGEYHPKTATSYSNLANILQDLGDYKGAKFLLQKAVTSDETNFGKEHSITAVRYSNLGLVLQSLGDYKGAKILLEKNMRIMENNFGVEHPYTAQSYSNLASVLQDLGNYVEAKSLFEKAVRCFEEKLGQHHPTTTQSYSNLAGTLHALGNYEGAKKLLEKAVKASEVHFGEQHPTTAIRYSNLAMILKDIRQYEQSFVFLFKAYRIMTNHFEEKHPYHQQSIHSLNSLVDDMLRQGWTEKEIHRLKSSVIFKVVRRSDFE